MTSSNNININKNKLDNSTNTDSVSEGKNSDMSFQVNKKGFIEIIGEITELLPGLKFRVELENGQEIIATMKGKMRMHNIKVVAGDKVKVEMSAYDMTKGRIIYRQ